MKKEEPQANQQKEVEEQQSNEERKVEAPEEQHFSLKKLKRYLKQITETEKQYTEYCFDG